jgi:hypothetical protein
MDEPQNMTGGDRQIEVSEAGYVDRQTDRLAGYLFICTYAAKTLSVVDVSLPAL